MQKFRNLAAACACMAIAAAALVVALGSTGAQGAGDQPKPLGDKTAGDVNRMLGELDQGNVERSIRALAGFGTRHTLSSQTDPKRGIGAARDWIYSEFQRSAERSGGRMTVEKQSFVQPAGGRIPEPTTITNVVATLRGTQPASADRTYVVSGHYDSRCTDVMNATCDAPGANDDASGVAAVLEMARVMASRKFEATIVFMAVAGEEQGLLGANHYADQAKAQNQNIDGMFTNDIVGSSLGQNGLREPFSVRLFAEGPPADETAQERTDRLTTGGENDTQARQLARYAKDVAESADTGMDVRVIYKRDRYRRGGDHIPFLENRYPAARFTEVNEDYRRQHQDLRQENGEQFGDLVEFVDFAYTTRVAKVNAATLAGLASAPAAPSDVVIRTGQLSNDTTLEWGASSEPDIAGYEIVYRDTVAPQWTDTVRVGKVTGHTVVGVTKDNFTFGVRAVDRDGNRSPVTFPKPIP